MPSITAYWQLAVVCVQILHQMHLQLVQMSHCLQIAQCCAYFQFYQLFVVTSLEMQVILLLPHSIVKSNLVVLLLSFMLIIHMHNIIGPSPPLLESITPYYSSTSKTLTKIETELMMVHA